MICSAVSRGALSWGQCPVASSVTSTLPGMCCVHVRPHLGWGDHVLSALQHQRRDRDLREVGAVVGQEGGAGEHLGDVRVHLAEAVRQLLAQLRPLGIAHDHRRHGRGPAQVVVAQRLEELLDVRPAEPPAVVAVVDVARRRGHEHQLGEPLRLESRREHADHRADRVPDEHHLAQIQLPAQLRHVLGVAVQRRVALRIPGAAIRATRADEVERDHPEHLGQPRRHQPPHVLITPEAVGEHHHPPRGRSCLHDMVPGPHVHALILTDAPATAVQPRRAVDHAAVPAPVTAAKKRTMRRAARRSGSRSVL